jgi:hypothetical protein
MLKKEGGHLQKPACKMSYPLFSSSFCRYTYHMAKETKTHKKEVKKPKKTAK